MKYKINIFAKKEPFQMKKFKIIFAILISCVVSSCGRQDSSGSIEDDRTNSEYFQDEGWSYIGRYKPYILVNDCVGKSTAGSYYLYKKEESGHENYGILEDCWAQAKHTYNVHMHELIIGNYIYPEKYNGEYIGDRYFNAHFENLYFEL